MCKSRFSRYATLLRLTLENNGYIIATMGPAQPNPSGHPSRVHCTHLGRLKSLGRYRVKRMFSFDKCELPAIYQIRCLLGLFGPAVRGLDYRCALPRAIDDGGTYFRFRVVVAIFMRRAEDISRASITCLTKGPISRTTHMLPLSFGLSLTYILPVGYLSIAPNPINARRLLVFL